jgi:hypothetical protein
VVPAKEFGGVLAMVLDIYGDIYVLDLESAFCCWKRLRMELLEAPASIILVIGCRQSDFTWDL